MQAQYQNQLQFNLGVPASDSNMAVRYHRPGPIVIEKCGSTPASGSIMLQTQPSKSAFEFNSISEDRLSAAIQLAKRDIKKKKFEESLREMQKVKPVKSKSKVKATPSASSKRRLEKSKVILIKEREISKDTKSTKTQTRKKPFGGGVAQSNAVVYLRNDLPVRSMSPPTRDTGPVDYHTAQQERHLKEIKRLRKDVQKYMQQMQDLERKARLGQLLPASCDLEQDEQRRREIRAEEQAIRSARTLYTLQKQVQDNQTELVTLGSAGRGEKNQTLGRLASAHRSAARMLQTCINQLPDQAAGPSFIKTCRELTLLVRQLSLCCAQVQVYGDTEVPDDVMDLVNEATAFSDQLDKELQNAQARSPVNCSLLPREKDNRKKQNNKEKNKKPAISKERVPASHIKEKRIIEEVMRPEEQPKTRFTEETRKQYRDQAVEATPERDHALRAGIAALMRAADSPQHPRKHPDVPKIELPSSPHTPRVHRQGRLIGEEKRKTKGLLLPSQLQAKRERAQKARVHMEDAHFAEPTISSRMRQVIPQEEEKGFPTPRSPRSPRRDVSPRARSHSPRAGSRFGDSDFDSIRRDVARQVMKDQETFKKRPGTPKKQVINVDFIEEAERRIQEKLKPLLEKAQDIYSAYEATQTHHNNSLRHRLSEKAAEQVETNVDLLADMILHDVLADTALELQRLEDEDKAESEAVQLQDAPDVSVMLQRLKEMELEQDEIRKRWSQLAYEDEFSERVEAATSGALFRDVDPGSPQPVEVTCSAAGGENAVMYQYGGSKTLAQSSDQLETGNLEAIRFTKKAPVPTYLQRELRVSGLQEKEVKVKSPRIPIFLSKQMISSIRNNKAQFEKYLQDTAHQPTGKFDPWSIIENLADEILADCMDEVSKELDQISTDMVEHVYKSEFTDPTDSNLTRDNQPNQS